VCFLGLSFLARSSIVKDTSRARGLSFHTKAKVVGSNGSQICSNLQKNLDCLRHQPTNEQEEIILVVASSPVEAATAAAQQHFHFN
jgi:hypothetical protein